MCTVEACFYWQKHVPEYNSSKCVDCAAGIKGAKINSHGKMLRIMKMMNVATDLSLLLIMI